MCHLLRYTSQRQSATPVWATWSNRPGGSAMCGHIHPLSGRPEQLLVYDDLIVALSCELAERLWSIRSLLEGPVHRTRRSNATLARTLSGALDAVADAFAAEVVPFLRQGGVDAARACELALTLDRLSQAVRAVHQRLSYLTPRLTHHAPDVLARKLRADGVALTPSPICYSDDYDCLDQDVAQTLRDDLERIGVGAAPQLEPIIVLPRAEATNPLVWTLLLDPLCQRLVSQCDLAAAAVDDSSETHAAEHAVHQWAAFLQCRLGGPAAFAAAAAHALFMALPERPPRQGRRDPRAVTLSLLGAYARPDSVTLTLHPHQESFFQGDLASFYAHLLHQQGGLLGRQHDLADTALQPETMDLSALPRLALPVGDQTADLFAKLDAGTPINAISATVPPSFGADLDACTEPTGFYALLGGVAEQPASLATILSMGWLFKAQRSYALFRDLLRDSADSGGAVLEALAAYGAHVGARNLLLQQSLEAAYVHQIFAKWGAQDR